MRIIWDVYAVLLSCPDLLGSTSNHTQPVDETGKDDFPQFSTPFRTVTRAFEDLEFPLDIKENMLLLGVAGLHSTVHITFRVIIKDF